MSRFPTPDHEGHWWGKLVHPENEPDGVDMSSLDYEVCQVFDNNGTGLARFRAFVPGLSDSQPIDAFVWGPEVVRPKDLAGSSEPRR